MNIYEVTFQHKTTGLIHTDLVQGRYDTVEKWSAKEADVYNCSVTHIKKTDMPKTRAELKQLKII